MSLKYPTTVLLQYGHEYWWLSIIPVLCYDYSNPLGRLWYQRAGIFLRHLIRLQCDQIRSGRLIGISIRMHSDWETWKVKYHYTDVIMGTIACQITSLTIVYSTVYSGADQRKHQSSASLAFVWGIHRGLVNSPHKGPVTRRMFPFDDVRMTLFDYRKLYWHGNWITS